MEKILLNRTRLSRLVWDYILDSSFFSHWANREKILRSATELESLRVQASYNTGSISSGACWVLYSLSRYLKPQVVAEVGTFIGKSTNSIAQGMEDGGVESGSIFTCDLSNDIKLQISSAVSVRQFPMRDSAYMFGQMASEGIRANLLFVDGRLQDQDFALLGSVIHEETVIALDDFEGVEKGVANAMALMGSLQKTHALIYPPTDSSLAEHGFLDGCKVALIIPMRLFAFSNQ